MKQQTFVNLNRSKWKQFEGILSTQEEKNGLLSLFKTKKSDQQSQFDADEFVTLYREMCHLQSMAKTRRYSSHLVAKLDDLTLRGHSVLYGRKPGSWRQLIHFFVSDYPRLLRQEQIYFWLASGIFYLPALVYFLVLQTQPELIYALLDYFTVENFEEMYDPSNTALGEMRDSDSDLAMFGFYIYNNISVAFRTFASGIIFGIGSIFFLIVNGLLLGGVLGHLNNIGYIETISSFVIGHGSFELTAIVISGAAGMRIGFSLLSPGNRSRLEALKISGTIAIKLMYGAILMLVIAAFIEGFWSSSVTIQPPVKYTVGIFLWLLVFLYLGRSGKANEA